MIAGSPSMKSKPSSAPDVARAELAHERAEQGLAKLGDADAERFAEFEQGLERARNRIAVSGRRS